MELERVPAGFDGRLFAKLERFNPGGSIKDRPAISMLMGEIRSGRLIPGRSVVVESSSGNLAVGLAQVCRYHDIRFICVVDAKTTEQNLAILRALHAEVEVVTEPDADGEYLSVRLRRVRELVRSIPHAYWPNQYANEMNPRAHFSTMNEIVEALDGRLDYLFTATSTTGTLLGCKRYVREHGLATKVVAVDAVGSVLFEPGPPTGPPVRRLIPGHGASVRSALFEPDTADEVVHVTDLECVVGCRRLSLREALLAGGSSGATLAAFERLRPRIAPGSLCVLIFPDGGDRYLHTIYSDSWVQEHFGEVSHLWKTPDSTAAAGHGKG
ncbi:2,3-diaminopropionate biosynthesis protein SbnA [Catenulispora sp. GP43]